MSKTVRRREKGTRRGRKKQPEAGGRQVGTQAAAAQPTSRSNKAGSQFRSPKHPRCHHHHHNPAPNTRLEAALIQQHLGCPQRPQPQRRLVEISGLPRHNGDGTQAQQVAKLQQGKGERRGVRGRRGLGDMRKICGAPFAAPPHHHTHLHHQLAHSRVGSVQDDSITRLWGVGVWGVRRVE